ncbi:phage baseplate assembly protein V [Oligoflexus tunisiensis]|uniref:phage baseplate assembly protein V n=1 Tax=Oligoflexus tunisiensis TaxID=708132 RepID=UPI00114CB693|nr:phage baseplate assembly protein V [Oligoflexus tunisiensis]
MDNELAIQDLSRRMDNLLRPGKILAVDHERARARVRLGENLYTTWLPCFARRAGNTIDWDPPEPGEQCLVLAPGGELAGGFVLTGLYSSTHPAPAKEKNLTLRKYPDGLELSYDHAAHTLTIRRPDDLSVIVKGSRMEFWTDKFEIFSRAKFGLMKTISDALKSISKSKTSTMMGPQNLLPAATELPGLIEKIDSFGG